MAKATKKSEAPTKNIKPSTSNTKSKKAKTHHVPKATKTRRGFKTRTAGKKDGESSSRSYRVVQMTTKKVKKTPLQSPKKKASEKTTTSVRKTKKCRQKSLFGHYHRLMEEMTGTGTCLDQRGLESSSTSASDLESQ